MTAKTVICICHHSKVSYNRESPLKMKITTSQALLLVGVIHTSCLQWLLSDDVIISGEL